MGEATKDKSRIEQIIRAEHRQKLPMNGCSIDENAACTACIYVSATVDGHIKQ